MQSRGSPSEVRCFFEVKPQTSLKLLLVPTPSIFVALCRQTLDLLHRLPCGLWFHLCSKSITWTLSWTSPGCQGFSFRHHLQAILPPLRPDLFEGLMQPFGWMEMVGACLTPVRPGLRPGLVLVGVNSNQAYIYQSCPDSGREMESPNRRLVIILVRLIDSSRDPSGHRFIVDIHYFADRPRSNEFQFGIGWWLYGCPIVTESRSAGFGPDQDSETCIACWPHPAAKRSYRTWQVLIAPHTTSTTDIVVVIVVSVGVNSC